MNTPSKTNSAAGSGQKPGLPKIRLKRFKHRDCRQIGLQFPFNQEIKTHLMRLEGIRWTQTHRCFYIADQEKDIKRLIDHCRGKVWLELSDLGKVRATVNSEKVQLTEELIRKIDQLKTWMQQKRYQAATIRTYLSFIRHFFAQHPHLAWDGITQEIIVTYNHAHFIAKKGSFSAQNQWINAVKLYLKVHALDVGKLEEIERPRRGRHLPEILSEIEVSGILSSIGNLKHKALLMLLYSAGLRIGEALRIRIPDIRSEEGLIYIRGSKGNKDRRVPLSSKMLEVLRMYHDAYRPAIYLFEGNRGAPYTQSSARKVLKQALTKAKIDRPITLHTLRHSYATHLTNRGVNIQYLQEILGHQSPKTTMLYTHLSGKDIRNIKSPLDEMDL